MNENQCVCCGDIIPEGRMICWDCEHTYGNIIENKEKVEEKHQKKLFKLQHIPSFPYQEGGKI